MTRQQLTDSIKVAASVQTLRKLVLQSMKCFQYFGISVLYLWKVLFQQNPGNVFFCFWVTCSCEKLQTFIAFCCSQQHICLCTNLFWWNFVEICWCKLKLWQWVCKIIYSQRLKQAFTKTPARLFSPQLWHLEMSQLAKLQVDYYQIWKNQWRVRSHRFTLYMPQILRSEEIICLGLEVQLDNCWPMLYCSRLSTSTLVQIKSARKGVYFCALLEKCQKYIDEWRATGMYYVKALPTDTRMVVSCSALCMHAAECPHVYTIYKEMKL